MSDILNGIIVESCRTILYAYIEKYKALKQFKFYYSDVLQLDKQNADAIYVRGLCLYYGCSPDNIERAFTHFQLALKLAPDHSKLLEVYKKAKLLKQKKEEGNDAFKATRFKEAYDLYTEALNIDPNNNSMNAKLYFNRATVLSKVSFRCFLKYSLLTLSVSEFSSGVN